MNYKERTTHIGLRVDNALADKLKQLAVEQDRTVSYVITKLLQEAIDVHIKNNSK